MEMNRKRNLMHIILISLFISWIASGCNDNSNPNTTGTDAGDGIESKSDNKFDMSSSQNDNGLDQKSDASVSSMSFGWVVSVGEKGQYVEGHAIALDANGNIYVTGIFNGNISFGNKSLATKDEHDQIFITKMSPSGEVLWAISTTSVNDYLEFIDTPSSIAVDGSGNAYVAGSYSGQITFGNTTLTDGEPDNNFIAKISSSGDFIWAIANKETDDASISALAADGSGNVYATGSFTGELTYDNTTISSTGDDSNAYVFKISPSGNVLWAKSATGEKSNSRSITLDEKGNAYLTGNIFGQVNFGSSTLAPKYDAIFVAMISSEGNFLWAAFAEGDGFPAGESITVDHDGNTYVTGKIYGETTFGKQTIKATKLSGSIVSRTDVFAAKISSTGDFLWAVPAGGDGDDIGDNIALDGKGNVYITGKADTEAMFGNITLSSMKDDDLFVAKISSSGDFLYAISADIELETASYRAKGIGIDKSGNAYITGTMYGESTFGKTKITSKGASDLFVSQIVAP
jgi:hypothetical protein